MWRLSVVISVVFAILIFIFAKMGIKGINFDTVIVIRICIILALAWSLISAKGNNENIAALIKQNRIFLMVSGLSISGSSILYVKARQAFKISQITLINKSSLLYPCVCLRDGIMVWHMQALKADKIAS